MHNPLLEILARDESSGFILERHELPAGFRAEKHRHTEFEWVYVISGTLQDEFGSYPAGTFKLNEKDSVHESFTETGCSLLVFTAGKRVSVIPS